MHPAEHQREKEDCVAADMHMLPVILDHDRILPVLRGFTIMGGMPHPSLLRDVSCNQRVS